MKNHKFYIFVVLIVIGFAILGCRFRSTYTDLTSEENYLDSCQVAEMPESIGVQCCRWMIESLPEAPIIVRAAVTEEIEHLFGISRQKVIVKEVFAGSRCLVGQEVYLTSQNWSIIAQGNERSLELGFVNLLKEGRDYLVFISGEVSSLTEKTPVYQIYDAGYILPVFCYDYIENIVIPVGVPTYVPYLDVKDNEFFATTERTLSAWIELKEVMLRKYPAG